MDPFTIDFAVVVVARLLGFAESLKRLHSHTVRLDLWFLEDVEAEKVRARGA